MIGNPVEGTRRAEQPVVQSRVWSDVSLDAEGMHSGYFRVAHSSHASAYGCVPIPVVVVKNGPGPRALLIAGNHGDEWEGQIVLMNLLRRISKADVRGQIIILPGANPPAVEAGLRVSPLDGGNLNRSFPGTPDGSPTSTIAHFIETMLLPRVDLVCDLHSGGSSLEYLPSTVIVQPSTGDQLERLLELVSVFGMPIGFITEASTGGAQSHSGVCERTGGVPCLSTELGGGGSVNLSALKEAEAGLSRLLQHLGVLVGQQGAPARSKVRLYRRHPVRDYLYSPAAGVFEPFVGLGDVVAEGQPAGILHVTDTPWREPILVHFGTSGTILCRRVPARTALGDCLFNTADEWAH